MFDEHGNRKPTAILNVIRDKVNTSRQLLLFSETNDDQELMGKVMELLSTAKEDSDDMEQEIYRIASSL